MGNFYVNYTLKGPEPQNVATALKGRKAFVTPQKNDCVVVFDQQSDEQDTDQIAALAKKLSKQLNCPLLAVLNHDDDILWYQLYENGQLTDQYNSAPSYFEPSENILPPAGGDPQKLCNAFGVDHNNDIKDILQRPSLGNNAYFFAFERHYDLINALEISDFALFTSYATLEQNEYPNGLAPDEIINTE
jgi:hypothetical protein